MNRENIDDIGNSNLFVKHLVDYTYVIQTGVQAIALDYAFYKETKFNNSFIFEIRDDICYRVGSCGFHANLLFSHLYRLQTTQNNHQQLFDILSHLESAELEVSYILDSIIVHLASLFDYSAILVHHVISDTHDKPKWTNLTAAARAGTGLFAKPNTDGIKAVVLEIDKEFVDGLYKYRSEVMHCKAEILRAYAISYPNKASEVYYLCSAKQRKSFNFASTKEYTVSAFVQLIIYSSIDKIIKLIDSMKAYLESIDIRKLSQDSTTAKGLFMIDKTTKNIISASIEDWSWYKQARQRIDDELL